MRSYSVQFSTHYTSAAADSAFPWAAIHVAERLAAALLFIALLPAFACCAALILFLSRSTPLIAHPRVGRNGAPLWVFKFRTMWTRPPSPGPARWVEYLGPEQTAGPVPKRDRDPRVTSRFARWCRRYSIDELPQFANMFLGDMSFVGPRPLTLAELRQHYGDNMRQVLSVRPGITGLWQVAGRSRLSYAERCELDLKLVRELSVGMYAEILARTIPLVLAGRDAW